MSKILSTGADRIYRSAKGDSLVGGVRVNAYLRWSAAIEPGTSALDIIHVSDLYTTLSRIGGGIEHVPTDRVIDGVDQKGVLLMG